MPIARIQKLAKLSHARGYKKSVSSSSLIIDGGSGGAGLELVEDKRRSGGGRSGVELAEDKRLVTGLDGPR